MTHYVLELGFNVNSVYIQGSDTFKPLQYGLRFEKSGRESAGRWLSSLVEDDILHVEIFDISTLAGEPGSGGVVPTRLSLQFLDVSTGVPAAAAPFSANRSYGGAFADGVLSFDTNQMADLGLGTSWVFGGGRRSFPEWKLMYPDQTGDQAAFEVIQSCYKLSIVLDTSNGDRYAFDPEWVVDPYAGGGGGGGDMGDGGS